MAFLVTVKDSEGRGAGSLLLAHHSYVMPGGKPMPILAQVAWCRACRRFVAAERLPTAEERRREVADRLRAVLEDQPAAVVRDAVDAAWKRMRGWFEWRAGRQSPPRCLECGASNFVPVEEWGEPVTHPEVTGTVVVTCRGHLSMTTPENLYTPEGLRIDGRQGAAPTPLVHNG